MSDKFRKFMNPYTPGRKLVTGIVLLMLWFFLLGKANGNNPMANFGKARTVLGMSDNTKVTFDDVAGADEEKEELTEIVEFLKNPNEFSKLGARIPKGVLLVGPPGTGKTMIAAAIANEIGAKFCSVKPSDLLHQGAGQSEKAVKALFAQARQFPCAVIYFDEMDSISPKNTKSQYAKQLRSEFLSQLQGVESYGKDTGNILFLIAATNKPWDIDSAFISSNKMVE